MGSHEYFSMRSTRYQGDRQKSIIHFNFVLLSLVTVIKIDDDSHLNEVKVFTKYIVRNILRLKVSQTCENTSIISL